MPKTEKPKKKSPGTPVRVGKAGAAGQRFWGEEARKVLAEDDAMMDRSLAKDD